MKVLVVAVLGLLAINAANAADLKCYQCESCHDIDNLPTSVTCSEDTVQPPRWAEVSTTQASTPETTASTTPASTPATTPATTPNKFKREIKADEATFQCFKQVVKLDGSNRVIRRGCTKSTEADCKTAAGESCDLCSTDECNFANNIQSWTFGSLLIVAIIKMFF